jgi:uncharacterized protein (DUF427 family)
MQRMPVEPLETRTLVSGAEPPPARDAVHIEPSPRWVRAFFGGVAVADSRRALLVFEPKRLPVYWFPLADVRTDLLVPAEPGGTRRSSPGAPNPWTLRVGERTAEKAAWTLPEPGAAREPLRDHIAFFWDQMDHWFEEDDEVFVHARNPYKRVDVLHSSRHVRVEVGGEVIAETRSPRLLFETGLPTRYYIPMLDVRMELLELTATTTRCPYKGVARYWSVRAGDQLIPDLVWSYPLPIPECPKIENLLCFLNERADLWVDGELQERPVSPWS